MIFLAGEEEMSDEELELLADSGCDEVWDEQGACAEAHNSEERARMENDFHLENE